MYNQINVLSKKKCKYYVNEKYFNVMLPDFFVVTSKITTTSNNCFISLNQ